MEWLVYLIMIFSGTFEVFAMLFIGGALFRIPYKGILKALISISIINSIIATINYDILELHYAFNELFGVLVRIVLYRLFFKTSYWHSFAITVSGYIASNVFLNLFVSSFGFIEWINVDNMMYNHWVTCMVQLLDFIVLVSLGLFLHKRNIGYLLMSEKIEFDKSIRKVNTALLASFLIVVFLLEVGIFYVMSDSMLSEEIKVFMVLASAIFFTLMYIRSLKEVEYNHSKLDIQKILNKIR